MGRNETSSDELIYALKESSTFGSGMSVLRSREHDEYESLDCRQTRPSWTELRRERYSSCHPNPTTGKPYENIRDQWNELIDIANSMLPEEEQIRDRDFYQWRATGASELAASGADPVLIAKLMGDTSLKTVLEHYFDSSLDHMEKIILKWDEPVIEVAKTSDPASESDVAA